MSGGAMHFSEPLPSVSHILLVLPDTCKLRSPLQKLSYLVVLYELLLSLRDIIQIRDTHAFCFDLDWSAQCLNNIRKQMRSCIPLSSNSMSFAGVVTDPSRLVSAAEWYAAEIQCDCEKLHNCPGVIRGTYLHDYSIYWSASWRRVGYVVGTVPRIRTPTKSGYFGYVLTWITTQCFLSEH